MHRVAAVFALLAVVSLTGCAATASPAVPAAVLRSSAGPDGPATSGPAPATTSSATGAVPPATTGCKATRTTTPPRALTAAIGDVDGDGRADTEWALLRGSSLEFGFTTASGATIRSSQGFAGGGGRSFVAGRLTNGVTVAITSEGRDSPLWSFTNCKFQTVSGTYDPKGAIGDGRAFVFYSADDAGAAGCLNGRLVGYRFSPAAKDHVTITAEQVSVSKNGLHATTGKTSSVIRNAPNSTAADFAKIQRYARISCGASEVLRPTTSSD